MSNNFDQVAQKTRQYWFSDGIVELSIGSLFFLLGVYFYLQFRLPPESLVLVGFQVGFVFILFGAIYLSRYLVSKLKSRITVPRTGYVSYKRASKKQRILSIVMIAIIAIINLALFLTTPLSASWIPAITGIFLGSIWLIFSFRVGLARLFLQSIAAYLLGVILSFSQLEVYLALAVFYGIFSLVLILSGFWTLAAYLRHHPPLNEGAQP
jgi:hypothetical protein